MFDPKNTMKIISGALFDHELTWNNYLPEAGNWQKTLLQITIPLIVVTSIAAYLLSSITADNSVFSFLRPTLKSTLLNMILAVVGAGIVASIFGILSGVFGGKRSVALGLAATTLAFVPGYLGQVVTWIPWIGVLLSIGLSVFALVLLWRIIPLYLQVPDGKRAAHYIVSLLATIAVMFVVSKVVLPADNAALMNSPFASVADSDSTPFAAAVSEAARTSELLRAAAEDEFVPPTDGKLTDQQVRTYLSNVDVAAEAYTAKMKEIEEVSAKVESDGEVSLSDISKMMKVASDGGGIATVEINAVKANGGNWAEHQWVRQMLVTAGRMKDANEVTAHNYALFQEYEEAIMRGMTPK